MIEGKTRITTIRLDAEADRKSRLMAEFYDKPLSEIYRDGINVMFERFASNDLLEEINAFESLLFHSGYRIDGELTKIIDLIDDRQFNQAAVEISAQLSKIPNTPENQDIINQGTRLVHLLTIN